MNDTLRAFFRAIDERLTPHADGQRLDLYLLGRSALVWRYRVAFTTKDIDVVELGAPLERKAKELFGKGSAQAKELGLYLDLVPNGLPPLPGAFRTRCTEIPGDWRILRLWVLDPHDLAATKMKSFRPQDRQDLRFLCDEGVLQVDRLRQSLEEAWRWSTAKDGDPLRDRAFANLELVIAYLEGKSDGI